MAHGVTPEPPGGSAHYREGWRDGYTQRELELHEHYEQRADDFVLGELRQMRARDEAATAVAQWWVLMPPVARRGIPAVLAERLDTLAREHEAAATLNSELQVARAHKNGRDRAMSATGCTCVDAVMVGCPVHDRRTCEGCGWTGPDDDVEIEGPAGMREFCPECGAVLWEGR